MPAATDPTVVNVPQLPGGLVLGITGLYLQAADTHGDLDYALAYNTVFLDNPPGPRRAAPLLILKILIMIGILAGVPILVIFSLIPATISI